MAHRAVEAPQRHFLIWLAETETICKAVRDLAGGHRHGDGALALADVTIAALRRAHSETEAKRAGRTAFRFQPPAGAERLMTAATIRARRRAG
jgi:hypothetical protein